MKRQHELIAIAIVIVSGCADKPDLRLAEANKRIEQLEAEQAQLRTEAAQNVQKQREAENNAQAKMEAMIKEAKQRWRAEQAQIQEQRAAQSNQSKAVMELLDSYYTATTVRGRYECCVPSDKVLRLMSQSYRGGMGSPNWALEKPLNEAELATGRVSLNLKLDGAPSRIHLIYSIDQWRIDWLKVFYNEMLGYENGVAITVQPDIAAEVEQRSRKHGELYMKRFNPVTIRVDNPLDISISVSLNVERKYRLDNTNEPRTVMCKPEIQVGPKTHTIGGPYELENYYGFFDYYITLNSIIETTYGYPLTDGDTTLIPIKIVERPGHPFHVLKPLIKIRRK